MDTDECYTVSIRIILGVNEIFSFSVFVGHGCTTVYSGPIWFWMDNQNQLPIMHHNPPKMCPLMPTVQSCFRGVTRLYFETILTYTPT